MNAVDMLIQDHEKVNGLFRQYQQGQKQAARQALMELEVHSKLEEEIFYPAVRQRASELQGAVREGYKEHAEVDSLISELKAMDPMGPDFDAKFQELMRDVQHHVQEEETEMLPNARQKLGAEAEQLGQQMMQRKQQLVQQMGTR